MMRWAWGLALLAGWAVPAGAAVTTTAQGFDIVHEREVAVPPDALFARLLRIEDWWRGDHSYSGDAANLRLEPLAGGCFCERWRGGEVEHARVVMIMPGRLLRLVGSLGPLQERAVVAVMTFSLTPVAGGKATKLRLDYRVAGPVEGLGNPVDRVLGLQFERLVAAPAR